MTSTATARKEDEELVVGSDRLRFKVTSAESGGEVMVAEITIPAGGGPPALHRHDPFELYRVVSGELTFYLETEAGLVSATRGGAGATIAIEGGREHTVRNESGREAEAVVLFSPGEPIESFVRAAAARTAEGSSDADGLMALAAAHGIRMTRPLGEAARDAGPGRPVARSGDGYLSIARFAGDPQELAATYRRHAETMTAVGSDHGLITHVAARTEDGLVMVNLWPSRDGSEAAARDSRRLGVLARSGVDSGSIERLHGDVIQRIAFG